MAEIKGILWDKDGILFDMEPVYCQANVEAFRRRGVGLSEEDYYSNWTRRGKTLVEFLQERGIVIELEQFRMERSRLIREQVMRHVPVIEGVEGVLENFHGMYAGALVTSSYREMTDLLLEISGFGKYFSHVITVEDVQKGKPDPEGFLLASERLGIDPKNLLVIEDAEKGVVAAHRAGMKCIAIPNKYTNDNDFYLATRVLGDIRELNNDIILSL